MHGGEPIALGVNNILPGVMFIYAKALGDVFRYHVNG
jgi:hypothetical protein